MTSPLFNKLLAKKNDKKTLITFGVIFSLIAIVLIFVVISHHKDKLIVDTQSNNPVAKIEPFQKISQFSESATGEAISDLQTSESLQSQQISTLTKENKTLTKQLKSMTTQNTKTPQSLPAVSQNTLNPLPQNLPTTPRVINVSENLNALPNPRGLNTDSNKLPNENGIANFTFSYGSDDQTEIDNTSCTPKNCVLPGTFARAVMLGAADANASVNGQSDTTPILFRILGRGVLPNGYHSHLKGCFVVGAVYGDISSERGEVKLSQISCVIKGKTISKQINGTAYFMGKEGVRGRAIMRNGPLLWNAGVAGMLSGLAQGVEEAQQTQSISPLGTTATVPAKNIAMSMGAGGVQSAANTLATYYIKRADQYHPIIELNAGTIVNLVFLNQFLLTPNSTQSSGALITTQPSNHYWQNPKSQNTQNASSNQGDTNSASFGETVSGDQANAIQNQINQAGNNNND